MIVHDPETAIELASFGAHSDVTAGLGVHTVNDLNDGHRAHVGNPAFVTESPINSYGRPFQRRRLPPR